MKKRITLMRLILPACVVVCLLAGSCNSKSQDDPRLPQTNIAVTSFTLKADKKVLSNLDSVFFSIDVTNGIIYNADSLPVGTPVSKLIPVIAYPSNASKVTLTYTDSTGAEKVVDYIDKPGDTIDFRTRVVLSITASNGVSTKDYLVRVNVHRMDPDSLWWDAMAQAALPSRMANPLNQKTVMRDEKIYTLVHEADNTHTLSATTEPATGQWEKQAVTLPYGTDLRTFTATPEAFYLLADGGMLYSSADGVAWAATGQVWTAVIGGYNDAVVGLRRADGKLLHTKYPLKQYIETEVSDDFPVEGYSNMGIYTTKWSATPLGMICGGRKQSGQLTGAAWAFDGSQWAEISAIGMPGVANGTLIPYYAFLKNSNVWVTNEFSIWLYMGGETADTPAGGQQRAYNRKIYISYNNGVNWDPAPANMQLPATFPSLLNMDHAVVDTPLEADFSPEVWMTTQRGSFGKPRLMSYTTDGYEVMWNCPFIYMFGGTTEQGSLSPTIRKGVINRLRFKPVW